MRTKYIWKTLSAFILTISTSTPSWAQSFAEQLFAESQRNRQRLGPFQQLWYDLTGTVPELPIGWILAFIVVFFGLLNFSAFSPVFRYIDHNKSTVDFEVNKLRKRRIGTKILMIVGTVFGALIATLLIGIALFPVFTFMTPILVFLVFWTILLYAFIAAPIGANMMGAVPNSGALMFVPLSSAHPIVEMVHHQCERLGIPLIRHIGYFQSDDINAYAMGTSTDNFTIALSSKLIETLEKDEVDAIIGHELGHVLNNDMRTMQYGRGLQNALTWFLLFYQVKKLARILFTTVSELALMKLSRNREYWADAVGAAMTSPQAMIRALQKIEELPNVVEDNLPPRQAANMFHHRKSSFTSILSTHPPTNARIKALQNKRYYNQLPWKEL